MKRFAQFYEDDREILGSDGIFILDARNTLNNSVLDTIKRANKLRHVKKINGFRIFRGDLKNNTMEVNLIKITQQ